MARFPRGLAPAILFAAAFFTVAALAVGPHGAGIQNAAVSADTVGSIRPR